MIDDSDIVNHPNHYRHVPGIEAIEICSRFNFCLGNALKYIYRNGHKGDDEDAVRDLRKAIWYIQKEIEMRISTTVRTRNLLDE